MTEPTPAPAPQSSANREVLQIARDLFNQGPDWVTFFREVLGLDGVVRTAFRGPAEREAFEASDDYQQIQAMLVELRRRRGGVAGEPEPTTVITVRLPKSLHDSLRQEGEERRLSMNRLCIAKLLRPFNSEPQADASVGASL